MANKNLDYEFDEYLKADSATVVRAIPKYLESLKKTCFRYGRFTIPTFYKGYFLSTKQERLLKRVVSTLHQVVNTAMRLYFEESHLSYVFRIPQDAAELIKIDPGYSRGVVFSRYDALLEGESLKIIEFNCDSPAGAGYTDEIEKILLQEKPLQKFFKDYHIQGTSKMQNTLNSLLEVYEEFGGYQTPHIAIVDWKHNRTTPEYEYLKVFFEQKGYRTFLADPRELSYKGGKLYYKATQIHLIYRRCLFDDILERIDEVEDMIRAYRDKAVCIVNPLSTRLASTKAFMSILTNPEYDRFFTETENKVKRECIPWTRRLIDAEDFYGRKKIYLIDFLKDEKESLILKPSTSYGGKNVSIGCETRDEDWNAVIGKALKEDWVVQEYIKVPIITVPVVVNDKLDFAYKKYNFNILVADGKHTGSFVRLSDDSVINVARYGGLMPSLTTEHIPERYGA
ncbi:MAG: glutathionylspermidine synthase family protein [Candidatus Omnitrophica bacterium]|nr:glutathionylspermidine synthase family protein [Candidatus Omnitrophota bacterium]